MLPAGSPTGSIQGQTYTTTQTVYVHADAAGSTRVITGTNGQPLVGYSYDPYGQETLTTLSSSTAPIVNPFLFQGHYVDPLTGFMYLRNRWYDPTTAQFLTRDPLVAQTRSAYAYAGGDPVNGTDPTGLCGSRGKYPSWVSAPASVLGLWGFITAGRNLYQDKVHSGHLPILKLLNINASEQASEQALRWAAQTLLPRGLEIAGNVIAGLLAWPVTLGATLVSDFCDQLTTDRPINLAQG